MESGVAARRLGPKVKGLEHVDSLLPIGLLHDPVTWYGINYTGTQITQWDFENKGTLTSSAQLFFESPTVLFASQHNLFRTM